MVYVTWEVQRRIHKGSPIIRIPSRINPIPRINISLFMSTLILSSHLRQGLPKGLFPVGLPVKLLKALIIIIIFFFFAKRVRTRSLLKMPGNAGRELMQTR